MTEPLQSSRQSRDEYAAIGWSQRDDDGPSFGWDHAKVTCAECGGWEGTVCPHGCGVRLVSIQAAKDAEVMERLRREDAERREWRESRRRERQS